ncbi:MAG: hypothetical protein ABI168_12245 [Ginsengibacter sp.]
MKRYLLFYCLIGLFVSQGCKKETITSVHLTNSNPSFDSATGFLQASLSAEEFATLDLEHFEELRYRNKVLGFKIFEKNTSINKFLLLGKTAGAYKGSWVDMSALLIDRQKKSADGSVTIKTLSNDYNATVIMEKNKVVQIIKKDAGASPLTLESTVLPEIIIYYDVYNNVDMAISFISLYWLFGENDFYSGFYFETSGSGGGSSGDYNASNVVVAPTFTSPTDPIQDLKKELGCFTNDNTASYTISVNVNQPIPNSREVFSIGKAFPVGHAFLTLDQQNSNGTHTIRNLGFYPKTSVNPIKAVDHSIFGDDSNTPFDVSLKIEVSGGEFTSVINNLVNQQSSGYDLNNFNCTTSLIKSLSSVGINLPSTKSTDPFFSGNNPGDLGEDIRKLDLNKFSQENGNRKIVRKVSNLNDQNPTAKKGTC